MMLSGIWAGPGHARPPSAAPQVEMHFVRDDTTTTAAAELRIIPPRASLCPLAGRRIAVCGPPALKGFSP